MMFCNQCEQATGGTGCAKQAGVCGKTEDIQSLQETALYGLKGIAAYAFHAREFGLKDDEVDAFMHEALFTTLTNVSFDLGRHVELVLKAGQMNLKVLELLDRAHTAAFGSPTPVSVKTGTRPGPGILVTGHDLLDLYELLKQTEGTGVNIYTHGEMLPAHGYPKLRAFKHLAGNYGGAWQEQKKEFNAFSGAILATTNCVIQPSANTYAERFFTTSVVGLPGVTHIKSRDFSTVIKKAKSLPALPDAPGGHTLQTGFHYTAVLGLADKIIAAVKAGKIKRFFLIGGCDGAKPGRNYFTRLAELVPKDCVIITVACGKYRFNHMDFGSIDGIPRLIDVGQCNDSHSAVKIAVALAEAFKCGVNDLPLSFVLSWFEQKAVAILLSLLYLGVKNIRIGPTAPAFITPNVFKVLHDKFGLKLITTPEKDLQDMLENN